MLFPLWIKADKSSKLTTLNYWGHAVATSQLGLHQAWRTLWPIKGNQLSSFQGGVALQDKIKIGFRDCLAAWEHSNKFNVFDVADQCFLRWRPAWLCMPVYRSVSLWLCNSTLLLCTLQGWNLQRKKPLGVACKSITYFIQIHPVVRGKCELKTPKLECIYLRGDDMEILSLLSPSPKWSMQAPWSGGKAC